MNIFRQLTEKPWLNPGPHAWADNDGRGDDLNRTAMTGLKLYFGVATVMFTLILLGFLMRFNHPGGGHEVPVDWRPIPKTWLLWYNSGILILSSIAWQWAKDATRRDNRQRLQTAMVMAGALGIIFLIGQLAVWKLLNDDGYFMTRNSGIAFFYVLVVLHGLHLLGGLFVWGKAVGRLLGGTEPRALRLSVDLCALYWHFLLAVWVVMFGLLLLG